MINLKIITMTNNKLVNERKAKNKVEELKKLGVMVTIWSFFINVDNFKSFPWIPFKFFLCEHTMTVLIILIVSISRTCVGPRFIIKTRSLLLNIYLPPKQLGHLGILPKTIPSAIFKIKSSLFPDIDCIFFLNMSFNVWLPIADNLFFSSWNF